MVGLSAYHLRVWATVVIYFQLCDSVPDMCAGMGKAMRKLKCGEPVLQEEKIYPDQTKQFESKHAGKMVQEHYADLPYPPFSFGDMAKEMTYYSGEVRVRPIFMQYGNSLDMLNHHLYRGNQTFADRFRVLIAGGGTGNSVCFMAEQLRNTNAEIVYLDFSPASLAIARQRVSIRQVENVKFVLGSIEQLPALGLGEFDFVESTGVLHHLPNPQQGLQVLADSLHEEGGGNLMLYARFGRTGIYQMQELARLVNDEVHDRNTELENIFHLIRSMGTGVFAKQNVIRRLDHTLDNDSNFYDRILNPQLRALAGSQDELDIEAYDRFCNKQDRAFSVQEIYDFVESAGLKFVGFNFHKERLKYEIENTEMEDGLKEEMFNLQKKDQQAIAELVDGSINGHNFFVSKQKDCKAALKDDIVPYIFGNPAGLQESIKTYFEANEKGNYKANCTCTLYFCAEFQLELPLTKNVNHYLGYLFNDNNSTFGELSTGISEAHDIPEEDLKQDFESFYAAATKRDLVLLRHRNTGTKSVGQVGKGLGLFLCS
eukprot:TRINITY_DN5342_c0_g1_i1.p1 TRINITY_DN5342_c0_g1~~TRINITY_DN5342_c0_g1_i1.p1  ORF type:complete len:542 (-),score=129.47 TRINITY_DN5342_c0_g1_i1:28-1653(-)